MITDVSDEGMNRWRIEMFAQIKSWIFEAEMELKRMGQIKFFIENGLLLYTMPTIPKPPIGIMPNWLWIETRRDELFEAIKRYTLNRKPVPGEWFDELKEHSIKLYERDKKKLFA